MSRSVRLFSIMLCLAAAIAALAQGQKRSITEKDLFQFNWIGDPQVSPDGSRVVFVKVTVNKKRNGYDTALVASVSPPRRAFTAATRRRGESDVLRPLTTLPACSPGPAHS